MSKATHRALPFHFGTVGTPLRGCYAIVALR